MAPQSRRRKTMRKYVSGHDIEGMVVGLPRPAGRKAFPWQYARKAREASGSEQDGPEVESAVFQVRGHLGKTARGPFPREKRGPLMRKGILVHSLTMAL